MAPTTPAASTATSVTTEYRLPGAKLRSTGQKTKGQGRPPRKPRRGKQTEAHERCSDLSAAPNRPVQRTGGDVAPCGLPEGSVPPLGADRPLVRPQMTDTSRTRKGAR